MILTNIYFSFVLQETGEMVAIKKFKDSEGKESFIYFQTLHIIRGYFLTSHISPVDVPCTADIMKLTLNQYISR